MAPGPSMSADEELARMLQAEMDEEFTMSRHEKPKPTPSSSRPRDSGRVPREDPKQVKPAANKPPKNQGSLSEGVNQDIAVLQEFYSTVAGTRCYKCRSYIATDLSPKQHLGTWSDALADRCGKKPVIGTNVVKLENGNMDWCCDNGRLFAIWVLLARYDQVELRMQEVEAKKAAEQQSHRTKDRGIGYVQKSGYDVFGMFNEATMYGAKSVKAIDFQSSDRLTDNVLGQILAFTTFVLPSRKRGSSFDKSPPPAVNAALRLGLLIDKVAELLRNDSIADISSRSSVYFPAMDFVKALATHESTADLVTLERYYKRGTSGLQAISAGGSSGVDPKGKGKAKASSEPPIILGNPKDGNAPAVISRLGNLVKQSEIMLGLGNATSARREFRSDADNQTTLRLCKAIVNVHTTISPTSGIEDALRTTNLGATHTSWSSYHRADCFELTEEILESHRFASSLNQRHSPKGRIPYLMKEMASMSTSLPEGIFVKASSETPGLMKCLIVGPDDTPYEGGLFEFDIGAGLDYPDRPPAVFFRGTHSGFADMNPNLHRDGKVCLSLLGTFAGPPESKWQSRKSTILSVLVSIQGMILNAEPWRNEPGNGFAMDKVAVRTSRQYTLDRMALTVRFAMLPWLTDRRWWGGVWKDIVRNHFRFHGDGILKTVRRWAKDSSGIRNFREPQSPLEAVRTDAGFCGGRDLLQALEKVLSGV
ncbi:MAG: hypothetical protein M1816_001263 [Peltula sp. TS41687]|nr:MAG: hypothetical protein M1816_001263 [Peltula sp. TS41687]